MSDLKLNGYKLIIFDVDGTIADRDRDQLYPEAAAWFDQHGGHNRTFHLALATNQGGVGLRHWMTEGDFGQPENYPDELTITRRMNALLNQIVPDGDDTRECAWYICYAYQSKRSGNWSPCPEGKEHLPEWSPDNRKPAPGMLLQAMQEYTCQPHETLMVGDGDEDKQAAINAGCPFIYAADFFQRPAVSEPVTEPFVPIQNAGDKPPAAR